MSRLLKSVRTKLAESFENRITRPVFFLVVLPPLIVWDWWMRDKEVLPEPLHKERYFGLKPRQPRTLEEAVRWLEHQLGDMCAELKRAPEEGLSALHHSIGRHVRNELKIDHPDDMSGLILTTLHRHLNGKPLDIEAQVCKYHEYWACYADQNRAVVIDDKAIRFDSCTLGEEK